MDDPEIPQWRDIAKILDEERRLFEMMNKDARVTEKFDIHVPQQPDPGLGM